MKKTILYLYLLINIVLLSSCSIIGDRVEKLNSVSDFKGADSRFIQILDFIGDKDKEGMKELFSLQALDEDFDKEITYIFELIEGEVISWKDSGVGEAESNYYGSKTKQIRSFYEVETDEENYLVFIFEIVEDTEKPENIGVYTIRIINEKDEDTQFTSWQEMVIPGIYMPEE